MAILRSAAFYAAFYSGSVLLVAASVIGVLLGPEPLRQVVGKWGAWHLWCVRHVLGIDVVIEGEVPNMPVLVAIKHESFFEAIDMPRLFDYPSVVAKHELFRIPGWGYSALVYGLIPVARDQGAKALREMIGQARAKIAEGRPLVIFPEGTRVQHGERPALQAGFAGVYKLLGLPVVPIAVDSGALYHRRVKLPGRITYKVGEVIPAGLKRDEVEARVREAINALNS